MEFACKRVCRNIASAWSHTLATRCDPHPLEPTLPQLTMPGTEVRLPCRLDIARFDHSDTELQTLPSGSILVSQHPFFLLSIHPLIHSTSWAIFGLQKNDATRRVLIASSVGLSVTYRLHGRVNTLRVGCSRSEQSHSFSCSISASSCIPLLSPTFPYFPQLSPTLGQFWWVWAVCSLFNSKLSRSFHVPLSFRARALRNVLTIEKSGNLKKPLRLD